MPEQIQNIFTVYFQFTYFYPLFMAYLWMTGAIIYYYHWEKPFGDKINEPPELDHWPGVSILVPCHNEGENIIGSLNESVGKKE